MLPLTEPPENLCILRFSALGDVTHVVPVIRNIHAKWPKTKITWVVGRHEFKLVGDLPDVEFIIFDKSKGWRAYRDLRNSLRNRRFSVLLFMQRSLRANIASIFVKSPIRLGFDRVRGKELHGLFVNHRIPESHQQHVLDGYISFLSELGITNVELCWNIPIPEQDFEFAEIILPGNQATMIISPCSNVSARNWSAWGYARVADYAIEKHDMRVALCGGRSKPERKMGDAIIQQMHNKPVDLIAKDTVKGFLALLSRAQVLITPDSGPAHLATAVGTPVIGLFACGKPGRTGPYLSRQWCVDKFDEAARRFLNQPGDKVSWDKYIHLPGVMDLIKPEDVISKIDQLMDQIHAKRDQSPTNCKN